MTPQQVEEKMIHLFIKLSEATGFINNKESIHPKNKDELQSIVKKYNIDPVLTKMLWQIVQKSPSIHQQTVNQETISIQKLNKNIQKQIFFSEYLLEHGKVSLSDINTALLECQSNPDMAIGQILLKKNLISSGEFIEINKKVSVTDNAFLRHISLKQHGDKVYLNNPSIPQNIGNYEIICEIARGGMGVVYQAKAPNSDQIVALKTIKGGEVSNSIDAERFQREAKMTSSLQHPNIIKVHDVNFGDNVQYYTMDYVDGVSLSEYVKENSPPLRTLLKIFLEIADALRHAHMKNIVHRDIKPSNILVDKTGKPFLTDFGLAKQEGKDGLTISGVAIGTPAYMPPEQAEGRTKEMDHRSDLYSLGAVLYECLCGQSPFIGNSLASILQKVINQEPLPLRQINPSIPKKVETICLKCLKKNRNQRYNNTKSFVRDVERFLAGSDIKAKKVAFLERFYEWLIKNRTIVFTVIITTLVVSTLFMYTNKQNQEALLKTDSANETIIKNLEKKITTINIENEILEKKLKDSKDKLEHKENEFSLVNSKDLASLYTDYSNLIKEKNPLHAEVLLSQAIKLDPTLASAYLVRGINSSRYRKQYTLAIKDFTKIIEEFNDSAKDIIIKTYKERSYCYTVLQQYHEAISDISACIGLEKNADHYKERALIYSYLEIKGNTLEDINNAVALQYSFENVKMRAQMYYQFGDYEKAVADFQLCIEIDPLSIQEMELLILQVKEKWLGVQPKKYHKNMSEAISYYYENDGRWAGKYKIENIQKIRQENILTMHAMYKYIPASNDPTYNVTGNDQRTFVVEKTNSGYRVLKMGGRNSATFPE